MNLKKSTHIILDSSVIAKWFFPSEDDSEASLKISEASLKIKDLFLLKKISISVPILIYYEINNLLRTAIKNFRISEKLAKEAYQGFLDLDLMAYSSKELMKSSLEKAITLDISSYDASYLALAENLKIPLITSDQKLIEKAKSDLVRNLRISGLF